MQITAARLTDAQRKLALLAVRIVQAAPALMTAVVWATNPWRTLALVGAAGAAAMLIALARLIHSTQHDEAPEPVIDWDAVAASVRIEITNDGSVVVVGISTRCHASTAR